MKARLAKILASYHGRHDELISILQQVQEEFGYLPEEAMLEVARFTKVPESRVYGVATFYSQFRLSPAGRKRVVVCQGASCHVRGAPAMLDQLAGQLAIHEQQTTPDGEYSLETTGCLGVCARSPCVTLDARLQPTPAGENLESFLRKGPGHE